MKLQEKIKSWCKDEKFMSFAQERARKEVCEVTENHRIDPQYEELDEAFEYDDRYIAPLVTYLTYKLRLALLQRNAGKRKRGIWWVLVHVEMQGYYVEIPATGSWHCGQCRPYAGYGCPLRSAVCLLPLRSDAWRGSSLKSRSAVPHPRRCADTPSFAGRLAYRRLSWR